MAKTVRVVGLSGCCDCAVQSGCDCASDCITGTLECRKWENVVDTGWTAWTASGDTGCTGTPPSCCAAWTDTSLPPMSPFPGPKNAQFRIVFTGLTPSTGYRTLIDIYRRVIATGSFTLFTTLEITGTSDGGGGLVLSGDVPNEDGYDTYAAAAACP